MPRDGSRATRPIRVVMDAMGGDYAPEEAVKGAVQALGTENIELILVGDRHQVEEQLARYDVGGSKVTVVPSDGKIGDDEHPVQGLRQKPEASILVATKLLKSGDADVLVSMGSTGASMASAVLALGLMDGLDRPCLGGPFLRLAPRTVLVDMGSSVDCRPGMLLNFAALGAVFARKFLDIKNPKVGLLSTGSEEAKGNRQVQESAQLLKESHLNFIGNVEGMDFFTGRADVIVCDGFVGNILMKFTEGIGKALAPVLSKLLSSSTPKEDIDRITTELWHMTNLPRTMGGPLFGVNGVLIVGHGSCKADGIAGAINTAVRCVKIDLVESMREELAQMGRRGSNPISSLQQSPQAPS